MGEKTQGGITMPNKDSFTFSDKLRKSKSVPLSKRLPSIVGGQNKQKRTLVQRAQRDLPFILVAALALLLLPFLSRTGSDDIASGGMGDWGIVNPDDQNRWIEGERDIMPEGSMEDPMKWIIGARSDVKESGATMGTDANKSAYGSGSSDDGYGDSSSGYSSRYGSRKTTTSSSKTPDYNTRKSYDEQYTTRTTKKPATAQYAKTTRPSVRKSFERKGTNINKDLRISQMPGHRGGSGISHALPLGQGPSRTPGTAFREGIRPVALQRMESRGGVGRGTEGLRAEADRSIREMNAGGPAKANLLAAQMRDIDGRPVGEGPGFGGPSGGGAASRLPGGGGPNNQNGYHVDKPWWWDMMQARSQKMWDLLYYKPREIFWNNLYNIGSQLMNCLLTGDAKGDVSGMFGKGAADSDWMCVKNGKEVMPRYNKQKTHKTKDKDGNTTEETVDSSWVNECINIAKGEIIEKEKDAKSFLDVRMECVGLDVVWDWLKSLTKHTKYDSHCEGVNDDPMTFDLNIERSNKREKHNTRRENKLAEKSVILLFAKVKEGPYKGQEIAIDAGRGNHYEAPSSTEWNKELTNCTVSKLVAFVSRKSADKVQRRIDKYNAQDQARYSGLTPLYNSEDGKQVGTEVVGVTEDGLMFPSLSVIPEQGQVTAGYTICTSSTTTTGAKPLTLNDARSMAELGKGKKGGYAECNVWETRPEIWDKYIHGSKCGDYPEIGVNIKEHVEFKATIDNSADKHVYAVLVDEIQGETKAKVSYIQDFGLKSNKGLISCDQNGSCTYKFSVDVASLGWNFEKFGESVKGMQGQVTNTMTGSELLEGQRDANSNIRSNASETTAAKERMYDKALKAYEACLEFNKTADEDKQQQCVPPQDTTQYASFNAASGSSSQGQETARGSGIIFWIVTNKKSNLKVSQHQDLGKDLGQVDISDLIESNETVVFSLCRYKWCNNAAKCTVPRGDGSMCYKLGDDGRKHYYPYEVKRLAGEKLLFPVDVESEDYAPTGQEPACSELCKSKNDEGEIVINCPHGKTITIEEAQRYLDIGMIDLIPLCNPYCQYQGKAYKATDIDGEFYITDATVMSINPDGLPDCHPLAWAWENGDFRIYDFVDEYDDTQLPLIPNQLMDATLTTHNTYTTRLRYLEQSNLFTIIRGQAIASREGDVNFKLFPRLVLPDEVDVNLVNACNFCGPSLYDNADVRAGQRTINDITGKIRNCFNQVKQLEAILGSDDPDIQQLKSVYYYGYASKRGSHDPYMIPGADSVGCTTSVHGNGALKKPKRKNTMWDSGFEELGDCNKALSEDRNLYIMDKVIGNLSEFEIDVEKEISYPGYRGFTNTLGPVSKAGKKPSYRLIKQPSASGTEFAFISYPCGSLGAEADYDANKNSTQAKNDRLVLITPINEGDDYCENRMTCGMADKKMAAIERSIKQKLSRKGISTLESSSRSNGATAFATATESDADFISAEEIAEVMRTESVDQNANPQA